MNPGRPQQCGCRTCRAHGRCGVWRGERLSELEQRYPDQWLAIVVPPGEDEYHPERGLVIAHSPDDGVVWAAVQHVHPTCLVHVYFNGTNDAYRQWLNADHCTVEH